MIELSQADKATLLYVEQQLVRGGYLAADQCNGIYGSSTGAAFAKFKADSYLAHPTTLGEASMALLGKLTGPRATAPAEQLPPGQTAPGNAGELSGPSIELPVVGRVYLSQYIVPDGKLTYAEFTHGGTRLLTSRLEAQNMLAIAELFRDVRHKFGSAIGITSAFRPADVNWRVGGVPNSWHVQAGALDMYAYNGDMQRLTDVLRASGAGEIGLADTFRHMSLGERRVFRYN